MTPPRRRALRPALLVAVLLMLVWVAGYWRLSMMSGILIQPSWAGLRGLTLYLQGQHAEAARAYRVGQQTANTGDYRQDASGYFALRAGDVGLAERRAETTVMLVPSAIEARVTLAEIALVHGRPQEALTVLEPVFQRTPDLPDGLYLAAVAHARLGEDDRAIEALNRALRTGSVGTRDTLLLHVLEVAGDRADRDRPLCLLAHLYRFVRIYDEAAGDIALRYARAAIAAGDRPADAYFTLGVIHDKRDEDVAAMEAFLEATRRDARHAEAFRWAAVKAFHRGDLLLEYRMARAAFEAAPTDRYYLRELERVVLGRLGDPHTMAALMEQAIAIDPANAAANERLARAASLLGDGPRAARHRERARTLRERDAEETGR